MKITHIISETTTSGSVATVPTTLFKQSRKGGNLLTGTKTKKKYANSIAEGRVKELQMDLSRGVNGISEEEFKQKYGKTKEEMRKLMGPQRQRKPQSSPQISTKVDEAKLDEEDLIMVPGMGRKLKSGFISHKEDRTDHEVEMARSDLFQSAKNAKKVYELISNISEDQGLEGWVQEKIIKANDYLNTIREYLEHKVMTQEGMKGAMLGGAAGAVLGKTPSAAIAGARLGGALQDKFTDESVTGAGVIAGGLQYEGVAEGLDQDVPSVLYHATYKPRLKSIQLKGLGSGGRRNYEDSQRGVVYLALDPDVAESYAETSDMVPDEWLDQIVMLKISTAGLDPNKFGIDSNVQDNAGDTIEYHGVIPVSNISLYKQGVAEGKITEKAVSQAQQKFMGMVHATQKGEKPASKEVAKVAKDMPKKAAKDFAQTKHKGLPEKKQKGIFEAPPKDMDAHYALTKGNDAFVTAKFSIVDGLGRYIGDMYNSYGEAEKELPKFKSKHQNTKVIQLPKK